jgi:WS/DGAT/MGAT family acyltransferase
MDRLTPEDLVMLWPDGIWPQDIGALAVLDRDPGLESAKAAVAGRLHLVPRFRQLLYTPPQRLGGPLWIDDPAFDIRNHVRVETLPAPGDEKELLLATERLRRRRLDRSRPLWEMWLLTGMPHGHVGMFVRTSHVIADGIAGVATLGSFLDTARDVAAAPAQPWKPAPAPSEPDLLADLRARRREGRRRLALKAVHLPATLRSAAGAVPAMRELLAERPLPPTSLDRTAGPDREIVVVRTSLDLVQRIAHAQSAKVNDVLLAVIAGGLRTLLLRRREPVDGTVVRIYVPVSLRRGQYAGARGNLVAQMVVPLPVGAGDPVERLRTIAAETAMRKARSRPSVGGMPTRGLASRLFLKLIERQRVNVESADIPGPPVPLYFAGAQVLELFPLLPLIGRVSLGVGALSYAGQFDIGVVADRDAYPDIETFAGGVRAELGALESRLHSPAAA